MENVLFIKCCPRPEGSSRTLALADEFIKTYGIFHEISVYTEDLYAQVLSPYGIEEIEKRDDLISSRSYGDPMFDKARMFAAADTIVCAAPYWDLSFPARLKSYVEELCVNGLTFHYTEHGSEGLSVFRKFIYITTSGGYPGAKDYGTQYMHAIANFLGNGEFYAITAEGLDIIGNDVDEIMAKAFVNAKQLAEKV